MFDLSPVVYIDPFAGGITTMPVAMVNAYVPYAQHLNLEEAARVAAIRDNDAATNFLLSVQDCAVLSMPALGEPMSQEKENTICSNCNHPAYQHSSTGCMHEHQVENESEYNMPLCKCERTYEDVVSQDLSNN